MKRTRDERLEGSYFVVGRERGRLSYWVHVPFAGEWIAAQRLSVQDGAIVVSEVRIFPAEQRKHPAGGWSRTVASVPRGGLSASLLRSVSIGGHAVAPVLTDWLEAVLYSAPDQWGVSIKWPEATRLFARRVKRDQGVRVEPLAPASRGARPGRKPTRDRAFYETIARDYIRWFREDPAKKISEDRNANRATVRTWIRIARKKYRLLPPAPGSGRLPSDALVAQRRRFSKS